MVIKKVLSLLLVLAVMLTGFVPQPVGASGTSQTYTVSTEDAAADASSASLSQTADGPAIIQNYPMPSIYTASEVFSLKADNEDVPVIKYLADYDYAQFSFEGT